MNNYTSLIEALIKAEMDNNPQHEKIVFVSETPRYLIEIAKFPDLPLVISGKIVCKAAFDHGISTSVLKRLPQIVAEPHALFRSQSQPSSVVVLTLEIKGGSPIIVPIKPAGEIGGRRESQKANVITSVYAKEGPPPFQKWQKAGLLLWQSG